MCRLTLRQPQWSLRLDLGGRGGLGRLLRGRSRHGLSSCLPGGEGGATGLHDLLLTEQLLVLGREGIRERVAHVPFVQDTDVNHILAEHGAQIRVEDNVPAGASFIVEIPAIVTAEPEPRLAEAGA